MTTRKFIEAPIGNPWRALALAGLAVCAIGCENTTNDTPDGGEGGTGSGGIVGGAGGSAGGNGGGIVGGSGGATGGSGGATGGVSVGGSGGSVGGSGGASVGGSGGEIVGGSGGEIGGSGGGGVGGAGGSGGSAVGGSGGEIGGSGGGGVGGAEPPPPVPCSAVAPGEFGDCRAVIGFASNGDGTCGVVSGCGCDARCEGRVFPTEADCLLTCVEPPPPAFCGGFAGIPCERGFECVDDPNDGCDPANGGADCGGICVPVGVCPDADADGRCDDQDGECNADGSLLMCRRVAPPCAAGTVPEVRNGCYTDVCVTWEQCAGGVIEPPAMCAPVEPGEFGLCDAVLGVGIGPDGTCQAVSGCGCDARCDGRVFATIDDCEAACIGGPVCAREPSVSPRDPMYDRYEGTDYVNNCRADADCVTGGCSGEVCTAEPGIATTCELVPPAPGACGCVSGQCQWYVDACLPPPCRSDADQDGICDDVDGECNLDGMQSICDRIPPACRAGSVPAVLNGCYTGECLTWDACSPAVPPVGQACGGFAGLPCPRGQACVDVPDDRCDPANGGADCPGMCTPAL
jgi:eight-cysteine-cluster-containing protein